MDHNFDITSLGYCPAGLEPHAGAKDIIKTFPPYFLVKNMGGSRQWSEIKIKTYDNILKIIATTIQSIPCLQPDSISEKMDFLTLHPFKNPYTIIYENENLIFTMNRFYLNFFAL